SRSRFVLLGRAERSRDRYRTQSGNEHRQDVDASRKTSVEEPPVAEKGGAVNCSQVRDHLQVNSDEDAINVQELRAHLRQCPACDSEWPEVGQLLGALEAMEPHPTPQGVSTMLTPREGRRVFASRTRQRATVLVASIVILFAASWS